jgi:hypothetical protein
MFGDRAHIIDRETKRTSFTYPMLEKMPNQLLKTGAMLRPVFSDFWDYSVDFMDRLERMNVEQAESNNIFDIEDDSDNKEESYNWNDQ